MSVATTDDEALNGRNIGTAGYRRYVVLSLLAVYTLNFIDRQLLGVMAQPIIAQFDLTDTQYGFLNGPPFALFYALMGIPLAMAADRWNRIRLLALCIANALQDHLLSCLSTNTTESKRFDLFFNVVANFHIRNLLLGFKLQNLFIWLLESGLIRHNQPATEGFVFTRLTINRYTNIHIFGWITLFSG